MDWFITHKLNKIGDRANPDREFVKRLGSRFNPTYAFSPVLKYSAGVLTALSIFVFGTGSYAYASDAVLPEHDLYPLRLAIEGLEDRVAITSSVKARVRLKHAKRRLNERLLSDIQRQPVTQKQIQRFVSNIEASIDANGKLTELDREIFDNLTARIETAFTTSLVKVREQTEDTQAKDVIDELIEKQTEQLDKRVDKLQEKRKEQFKRITERGKQLRLKKKLESKDLPGIDPTQLRQVLP